MPYGKSQRLQASKNASGIFLREYFHSNRIFAVKCNANRNGIAMSDFVCAHRFQFMRCPMPKVQRPSFVEFEGVSALRDVIQVQLSTASNNRHCCGKITRNNSCSGLFDQFEQRWIFQTSDLDRFAEARQKMLVGQRCQKLFVSNDCPRNRKSPTEIFLPKLIDTVLDTHRRIIHCQSCCWHSNEPYSAVSKRCAESNRIKYRTSANRQDKAFAVDAISIDCNQNLLINII